METMYDDGEEYAQGLQALQDEIMAQGQGLPEESTMMNMASEFAAWQVEQSRGYKSMGDDSNEPATTAADIVANGASSSNEPNNVDNESVQVSMETTREVTKRKLEDDDGICGDKSAEGEGTVESETEGPTPAKKTNTEINVRKLLPELEKLWKPVEENPADFTSWTFLLQYVDHENELLAAREAYDKFFARYPYCYGYWKKYADLEKRKGSAEDCLKVFKRGLEAIPLSVDLWIHYLNYIKATHESDPDFVREQYQSAVKAVGTEFRSDKLWEHYLQFEKDAGDLRKLTAVYDQLLQIPTQSYVQHFENFKEFVESNNPPDIVTEDEYLDLKSAVEDAVNSADEEERDTVEQKSLREKIIEKRSEVHKKTETEAQARWGYEEAIKRPYFHVKPLEKGQLRIWKEYLDFEIEKGDENRILVLFERCLIACCLYEEFWIKYVKYLQTQKVQNVDKIREVFTRACSTHHASKPWINLHWAAFEESQGQVEKAIEILENLRKVIPSSAHVYFRLINLHRRRGNISECLKLFQDFIEDRKDAPEVAHIKIKYARFMAKFAGEYERAVKLLNDAFTEHESSRTKTAMALVDLGMEREPVDFELVVSSFDKALAAEIPEEEKLTLAHRKVEFLDDYGTDVIRLQKAYEELQTLSRQVREKKTEVVKPEQNTSTPKVPSATTAAVAPTAAYQTPPPQYTQSGPTSAQGAAAAGTQDYGSQYSQYPGWNYQAQPGYGYHPQQQNWNAYGGYHG